MYPFEFQQADSDLVLRSRIMLHQLFRDDAIELFSKLRKI